MYKPVLRPAGAEIQPPSTKDSSDTQLSQPENSGSAKYSVLYRKKTTKKHKVWEGDAIATLRNDIYVIKDQGKTLASLPSSKFCQYEEFAHGSYEFEIQDKLGPRIAKKSVVAKTPGSSGTPIICAAPVPASGTSGTSLMDLFGSQPPLRVGPVGPKLLAPARKPSERPESTEKQAPKPSKAKKLKLDRPPTLAARSGPKLAATASELFGAAPTRSTAAASTYASENESVWQIAPLVSEKLRPHQVEAVEFLYKSISGKQHCYGEGAILADEMGLGKTLSCIALIYSLLQAGLVSTVLISCPSTLVKNWRNEFRKWIPKDAIGIFTLLPGEDPKIFCSPGLKRTYAVMIAGYERIKSVAAVIESTLGQFDLAIFDEGHRLKSSESKTLSALDQIVGPKRIILTGTPIQNNLEEFCTMAHFVNPGIFGSKVSKFTAKFSEPIKQSRRTDADEPTRELGKLRLQELSEITDEFVLRRDHKVLQGYLAVPKSEFLVFCRPCIQQVVAYEQELSQTFFWDSGQAHSLQLITKLRRISTSANFTSPSKSGTFQQRLESLAPLEASNKLATLKAMLDTVYRETDEKVVIVSAYMETLDLVQQLCGKYSMSWVRLDGSTPQIKRQSMVELFNKSDKNRVFAFLLSAKSGGAGLNLIGGSRLFMMDCDWNPSVDLQAMARIHRDGQLRPTYVYRLFTTGMIDEKILQRQITKQGMSDALFSGGGEGPENDEMNKFTAEQLREIFAYKDCAKCDTLEKGLALEQVEVDGEEDFVLSAAKCQSEISCILKNSNT